MSKLFEGPSLSSGQKSGKWRNELLESICVALTSNEFDPGSVFAVQPGCSGIVSQSTYNHNLVNYSIERADKGGVVSIAVKVVACSTTALIQ